MLSCVADLKKLATHCEFGTNLNEALRDKLVCGHRNVQMQKRLLSEDKLKYTKGLEIAVVMETAIHDASELSFTQNNIGLTRYRTTAKQLQYFPHRRAPRLTLVIGAELEETRTQRTIADSRARNAITVERWVTHCKSLSLETTR